jgi:hypothetical protein
MSLFEQLVQAVEEVRGEATRAADEEAVRAGRLCEQLADYLNAPREAIRYPGPEGGAMIHNGFPRLCQAGDRLSFQLEIATDTQQRHRFLLSFLFHKPDHSEQIDGRMSVQLGSEGPVFVLPSQREDFFDHVFVTMLSDLKTPEGQETARRGGVRKIG